jgi:hypothetical protein
LEQPIRLNKLSTSGKSKLKEHWAIKIHTLEWVNLKDGQNEVFCSGGEILCSAGNLKWENYFRNFLSVSNTGKRIPSLWPSNSILKIIFTRDATI